MIGWSLPLACDPKRICEPAQVVWPTSRTLTRATGLQVVGPIDSDAVDLSSGHGAPLLASDWRTCIDRAIADDMISEPFVSAF